MFETIKISQNLAIILIVFISIVVLSNCKNNPQKNSPLSSASVVVGAENLADYLPDLQHKKVALLVNQTSMIKQQHLVDALLSLQVNIKLIFAPEHGFRGKQGAGEKVIDGVDSKTGLAIISLHGSRKKPTAEQLKNIDILIFDIQDVGVRYYTYISSMHYLMEACAENSIPLIVLDRPNPNAETVDGPLLDLNYRSFVGMHPIPLLHGMTVGELALMINGEGWLSDNAHCELKIVKVSNYTHKTDYSLPVPPSPNLPNDAAVKLYPSLGFFEATPVSVGRGTEMPFQVLGYPDPEMGRFSFKPKTISGSWSSHNYAGETLYGESLQAFYKNGFSLKYFLNWSKRFKKMGWTFITRPDFLDKLSGSSTLRRQLEEGFTVEEIRKSWENDLKQFNLLRRRYLLYSD